MSTRIPPLLVPPKLSTFPVFVVEFIDEAEEEIHYQLFITQDEAVKFYKELQEEGQFPEFKVAMLDMNKLLTYINNEDNYLFQQLKVP